MRDLFVNADDHMISNSGILLAQGLNHTVVAEWVEEARQLEILRGQDWDVVPGFYFSRPLPAGEFAVLLSADRAR